MKSANLKGFLIRFFGALLLTTLSYNPSGYSFFHWATAGDGATPVKLLAGIVLLIGFGIYLGASYKSMGALGMAVVVGFLSVLTWVVLSTGWLTIGSGDALVWLGIAIASAMMAVGLYWATVWKSLTGQVSVQDTNDLESV